MRDDFLFLWRLLHLWINLKPRLESEIDGDNLFPSLGLAEEHLRALGDPCAV